MLPTFFNSHWGNKRTIFKKRPSVYLGSRETWKPAKFCKHRIPNRKVESGQAISRSSFPEIKAKVPQNFQCWISLNFCSSVEIVKIQVWKSDQYGCNRSTMKGADRRLHRDQNPAAVLLGALPDWRFFASIGANCDDILQRVNNR